MTVENTNNEVSYTGTGVTDTYAYTYRILQAADLLVTQIALDGTRTTLVLTTDYTVTGALSYTGGTITLTAGNLASGVGLVITRAPSAVQDTSLQSQGAYDAKVVETALDLLTMIAQYLQEQVDRAILVPPGTTPVSFPSPEALALLQWKADETGLQNLPLSDLSPILLAGNYIVDTPAFTPGVTTALTLSQAPGTVNNAAVYFDGVYQQKTTYTVSGVTLTLTSPVPIGVASVEVVQAGVLAINTPADNSVGTATVQNLAITAAKLADDAVGTAALIDGNVTTAKLDDGVLQAGKNAILDGSAMLSDGPDYSTTSPGTFGYGNSQLCKGALAGTTVAGTLTRTVSSLLGVTGRTFQWNAVTTAGSGLVKWRFFIEALDAVRFKNQTASLSLAVRHTAGVNISFAASVYKADVADVFSAVTVIRAGSANVVPTSTNTTISELAISMGDCAKGIMVEVVATVGAVTSRNFDLTEVQLELGTVATSFEFLPIATVAAQARRYYQVLFAPLTAARYLALGTAYDATVVECVVPLQVPMRATPTVTTLNTGTAWELMPGSIAVTGATSAVATRWEALIGFLATVTPLGAYLVRSKDTTADVRADARF